jgi:hypothetical protein
MSWRPLVAAVFLTSMMLAGIVIVLGMCDVAIAAHPPEPIRAGGGRTPCATVSACRRVVRWQRHERLHLERRLAIRYQRDATYAIRLASAAFHVPIQDMRSVASCESGMGAQVTAEAGSGASGLFQFLASTWQHTPYSGFDVFDPLPNALAAAQIVAHDGGWGQWTCKP